jgi:hypothetical protein
LLPQSDLFNQQPRIFDLELLQMKSVKPFQVAASFVSGIENLPAQPGYDKR